MPTNRRARMRTRVVLGDLDPWLHFELSWGPMTSAMPALEAAWEKFRHVLVPEWSADHPGTRPWAWWRWDAPSPRRQVNAPLVGGPGLADRRRPGEVLVGSDGRPGLVPWLEAEPAYLRRLGLLLPGEAARVDWREVRARSRVLVPDGDDD